jgi:uncharacterized protein (DUF983 family)
MRNEMNGPANRKHQSISVGIWTILVRGARMRCPRCTGDSIYQRWNVLKERCEECGFGFEEREGNCWFFLYSTTAALTGLFIIAILLWRPENVFLGRIVLTVSSFTVIALSLPVRKGIALALEYLSELKGSSLLFYDNDIEDNEQ